MVISIIRFPYPFSYLTINNIRYSGEKKDKWSYSWKRDIDFGNQLQTFNKIDRSKRFSYPLPLWTRQNKRKINPLNMLPRAFRYDLWYSKPFDRFGLSEFLLVLYREICPWQLPIFMLLQCWACIKIV